MKKNYSENTTEKECDNYLACFGAFLLRNLLFFDTMKIASLWQWIKVRTTEDKVEKTHWAKMWLEFILVYLLTALDDWLSAARRGP